MSDLMTNPTEAESALLSPSRLFTRAEVLASPSPVPALPGVYAWYFRELPNVPLADTIESGGFHLLYVGISPKKPSTNGHPLSRENARTRLRYHFQGNTEGSTLRLTLGSLLSQTLGLELRRVGSGNRLTFHSGEKILNAWLEANARVAWQACPAPWQAEHQLIARYSLPLNLDANRNHAFHSTLSALRAAAKMRARSLPTAVAS